MENIKGKKTKVVLNSCYGGFGLSEEAYKFIGLEWDGFGYDYSSPEMRSDEKLVACVEILGEKANGGAAKLIVEEIPAIYGYEIEDYDGCETLKLLPKKDYVRILAESQNVDTLLGYLEVCNVLAA